MKWNMSMYKMNSTIKIKDYIERDNEFNSEYQSDINSKLHVSNKILYGSLLLEKEVVDEIKFATRELWRILRMVSEAVVELEDDELIRMGYPKEIVSSMKVNYLKHGEPIGRFDFIISDNSVKAIGLNNTVPSLVKETFFHSCQMIEHENKKNKKMIFQKMKFEKSKVKKTKIEKSKNEISKNENWKIKILNFLKGDGGYRKMNFLKSPNEDALSLLKESYLEAISDATRYLDILKPKVAVIGLPFEDDKEGYEQTKFIFDITSDKIGEIELLNIKSLKITEEGVFSPSLEKIDILITPNFNHLRMTKNNGETIFKLIEQKKVAIVNSPNVSVLQNKFTLYVLWNMHLNGMLTEEDNSIVDKYLAPTFCTPYGMDNCIRKSVLGESSFRAEMINTLDNKRDVYNDHRESMSIYQDFFEPPSIEVIVDGEFKEKKFIIGSFICNGKPAGLSCLIGEDDIQRKTHWMAVSHI